MAAIERARAVRIGLGRKQLRGLLIPNSNLVVELKGHLPEIEVLTDARGAIEIRIDRFLETGHDAHEGRQLAQMEVVWLVEFRAFVPVERGANHVVFPDRHGFAELGGGRAIHVEADDPRAGAVLLES